MKTCSKCGVEKDVAEFSKDKNRKDGLFVQCKACVAEYYAVNREKLLKQMVEYCHNRCKTDPLFAIQRRLRRLTRYAFKHVNAPKTSRTFQLLGCTGAELLAMWGVTEIPDDYQIDHIVPLAQARTVEEAEALCHYNNLRLLTADENLLKSDSRTPEGEALCLALLGREWID